MFLDGEADVSLVELLLLLLLLLSLGEAELRLLVGHAGRFGKDGEPRLLGDVTPRLEEGEEEGEEEGLEGRRRSDREEMAEW